MTERPPDPRHPPRRVPGRPPPAPAVWSCSRCGRYLGTVRDGALHEPHGHVSALPCLRKCSRCGKTNVRT